MIDQAWPAEYFHRVENSFQFMKRFYISLCCCMLICGIHAQSKVPNQVETIQKIQSIKKSNTFLSARAAFDLYKKINKSAIAEPTLPAGSPQTYTFIWPQLKDGDNELFFMSPITHVSNNSIALTDGDIIIEIPRCLAAGFYMVQINCSFDASGIAETKLVASSDLPGVNQQVSSSTIITANQATNLVLGVNLLKGTNILRINCLNNKWHFFSLKILPLQ